MAKVVIVGGGVSGLSAGIYAQLRGHSAIICEKHTKAGGNLTGWDRGGYRIDNCIHWLTGTNPKTDSYRMWCELGALGDGINVHYGDSLFTCSRDGQSVSLYSDLEKTRRSMLKVSDRDRKETDDFIMAVRVMVGLMGTDDEKNRVLSAIMLPKLVKYYFVSTGELAKRFEHPLLKDLICGVMGEDFGALALVCVFAIFCSGNGGIPEGGSVAMAERMSDRFLKLGGQLLLQSEVTRIQSKHGVADGVHLSDGRVINADYVILACDTVESFNRLLGSRMPRKLEKQYHNSKMKIFSSIHTAFACDLTDLPFEADHVFAIPRLEERILGSKYLVLREFSHEPDFAPKGKNIIQALVFCEEKRARDYIALSKDKERYKAKKDEIASNMQSLIEGKFPSLCGKLQVIDAWTPATYNRYTNSETGAYMSLVLPPRMLPHRLDCKVKGFENVILATQWQKSPGGLPTAAECGRVAIEEICKREAGIIQKAYSAKKAYAK